MEYPVLYRKRIIPDECVLLKDDVILTANDDVIVTKWNALKPKIDLHHGYSCYFLKKGYKVSKFYDKDNNLLYWYCDIVEYNFDTVANTLTVTDLLADVLIYPDGFVKVVDIAEIAACVDNNSLTKEQLTKALRQLDDLLETIYSGEFKNMTHFIEDYED